MWLPQAHEGWRDVDAPGPDAPQRSRPVEACRPGTTPQQWAFARVNSFITGGGARKSDADLWKKRK